MPVAMVHVEGKEAPNDMKRKFSTIFSRCMTCDRIFRTSTANHKTCRTCREEREMAIFFQWLDATV
jgi:hypothetical protein